MEECGLACFLIGNPIFSGKLKRDLLHAQAVRVAFPVKDGPELS
jgi:hypothetical protein